MRKLLPILLATSLLTSCASYKPKLAKEARNWQNSAPNPARNPVHTMYLVGDAGYDAPDDRAPVLVYLKNKLATADKNSSIVFLGDNIYQNGMPPADDSTERATAEYRIDAQLDLLKEFKGRPVFVPGNHDWRGWGVAGLKREEKYVQKTINKQRGVKDKDDYEDYFLPPGGCPGPEVVELNDDVVILAIDSQWWLANWDKDYGINEGCEIKNREQFSFIFENVLRKYRRQRVVVVMHHPPYTYGPHGGRFTFKEHLFPLTELIPELYIPIPGLGSIAALYRGLIGSRQDMANRHYRDLREALLAAARKNGNFIFASGHEHTLQYIENYGQSFIVSGSGSKSSPAGLGKGSKFTSSAMGYATLAFYEGGETWVQYWEVTDDGKGEKLIFQKKIDEKSIAAAEAPDRFAEYEQRADSTLRHVSEWDLRPVGDLHKFALGEHYRELYLQKYTFPVLDLATYRGGLKAVKLGGGNQTNSLRLEAGDGREYVLRGLTKDVTRFLPYPFNVLPAAQYVVKDNFLSTNPFAPLAVAALADAARVYHTNPKIFYVPAQPALDSYNSVFGGTMVLFEERPNGKKWEDADFFGNADKILNTPEVLEEILADTKNRVDEPWMVRTRLFDFVVGDWDRHDDQWAWAQVKLKGGETRIRPIPKDRDQAFSRYDGLAAGIARRTEPFLRQLQSFEPEIGSMKWTTWSARLIDRTFLNGLDWAQWQEQVKFIQENLTDEVIDRAFDAWPPQARAMAAPRLRATIRARRDGLMGIARAHYELLGESVNVIGTEENERFVVERLDDARTRVTGYQISEKKGKIKRQFYQRTFESDVTKVITVYGNEDEDEFIVRGEVDKGIEVRLIGGLDEDTFVDSSRVRLGGRKTVIYDDFKKNDVLAGPETSDRRSRRYRFNVYDRRGAASNYDQALTLPNAGYNPDDGILLGASVKLTKYGFKKQPYASTQQIGGTYAFNTQAFKLEYTGDFIDAFRSFDFYLDAYAHGPTYAFNYAGLGNNSRRPLNDAEYYRVRQGALYAYPAVKKGFLGNSGFISLGPFGQISKIQATEGRYITTPENGLSPDIFDTKFFAGAKLMIDLNSTDSERAPQQGIHFNSSLDWTKQLDSDKQFAALRAQLSLYQALDTRRRLVLATQVGTGVNFGDGYEFFQMPTLGGKQGLRGYRTERFYGKQSFWHATDLRLKVTNNLGPALPINLGLFGSFDYGRVWQPVDGSQNWHNSYGGGLWLAPLGALTFSAGMFFPKEKVEESPRFAVKFGYFF